MDINRPVCWWLGCAGALGYPVPPVWPTLLISPSLRALRNHATAFLALCISALVFRHGDPDLALTAIAGTIMVADIDLWNMLGATLEPLVYWSRASRDRAAMRRIDHILQFGDGLAAARRELEHLHTRSVSIVRAITVSPSALRSRRAYRIFRTARRATASGGAPSVDDGGGDSDGDIAERGSSQSIRPRLVEELDEPRPFCFCERTFERRRREQNVPPSEKRS